MTDPKPRPKGPTTLNDSDLLDINHRHYRINLAPGVTAEDAVQPEFWVHVGKKLKPFDSIRLQAEDRTFIADLLVLSAGPGFAKVKLLAKYDLIDDVSALEAEEASEGAYRVKWNGPSEKYVVIRKSDDKKLKTGFDDKTAAENFALNHQRAVAA